ncbi:MAG: acyl-ACP--UDP-N-acetylglucosamine O-acyltransferase [Brevinema sp.]
MSIISSQAIISSEAIIGDQVTISPFCVIEGDVVIGDHTIIYPYVHIKGPVVLGKGNQIFNNTTIGLNPQDLSYKGSSHKIIIGDYNIIRENVTIHAPVAYDDPTISLNTEIGNSCLLMVGSHVAHNTVLKNHVVFANNVLPAGCCTFYDHSFISGGVLIHQHVRIGAHVIISGGSRVGRDIPPFMMVSSFYGLISGINTIGLRRAGFSPEDRKIAKALFRIFKETNSLNPSIETITEVYKNSDSRVIAMTLEFLQFCKRGISEFGEGQEAKNSLF